MRMTRQHFEYLAKYQRISLIEFSEDYRTFNQAVRLCIIMAEQLRDKCTSFAPMRFYKSCGFTAKQAKSLTIHGWEYGQCIRNSDYAANTWTESATDE